MFDYYLINWLLSDMWYQQLMIRSDFWLYDRYFLHVGISQYHTSKHLKFMLSCHVVQAKSAAQTNHHSEAQKNFLSFRKGKLFPVTLKL